MLKVEETELVGGGVGGRGWGSGLGAGCVAGLRHAEGREDRVGADGAPARRVPQARAAHDTLAQERPRAEQVREAVARDLDHLDARGRGGRREVARLGEHGHLAEVVAVAQLPRRAVALVPHRARLNDAQVIRRVAYGTNDVALVVDAHSHHLQEIDGRPRLPWWVELSQVEP